MNSKMPSLYLYYFGNESCNSILESYGIIKKENSQAKHLMSVQCSGCGEFNKSTNSFCIKCKAVLKYDEFIKTLDKEKQLSQKHEEEMKTMYVADVKKLNMIIQRVVVAIMGLIILMSVPIILNVQATANQSLAEITTMCHGRLLI